MYQVLHIRKIKTVAGLKNVAAHNSRENIYTKDGNLQDDIELPDWLNPNFSQDDFFEKQITNQPDQMSDNVLRKREKLLKGLKRKPQKNASAAIEFVVSASHEFKGDWHEFFGKTQTFLRNKFGNNCIQFAVHADETTPHMHVLFVPIVEKNGIRKYSSSEFLSGKFGLQKLHTEFYEQVGKRFGLERGELNSRATHNEIKDIKKLKLDIEKREFDFFSEKINWQRRKKNEEAEIQKQKGLLDEQKNALKTRSEALETLQRGLDDKKYPTHRKRAKFERFRAFCK